MSRFTEWPAEVSFTGPELDIILGALEYAAVAAGPDSASLRPVRQAQLLIWRKLWPELADQYEDPDGREEE